MVRLFVASVALLTPVSTQAQDASHDGWRFREVIFRSQPQSLLPGAQLGANARFGLGMFGIRSEATRQRPVTVREIDAPRQRRAGLGFSLKF